MKGNRAKLFEGVENKSRHYTIAHDANHILRWWLSTYLLRLLIPAHSPPKTMSASVVVVQRNCLRDSTNQTAVIQEPSLMLKHTTRQT